MTLEYKIRLDIAATGGFWLVNTDRVNLDDIFNAGRHAGNGIVRIHGEGPIDDAIRYMREDGETVSVAEPANAVSN